MASDIQTISWSTLQVDRLIGHGGYGDVYKGSWYGKQVAIKELLLKKLPEHLVKDFEKEARLMSMCKCAQVINLLGICVEQGHYAMVMDFMAKGSLNQVLHDEKEQLPWDPIRFRIAIDMGKGLAYLHDQKIVHRDLKSLNVLLDQNYNAKITDFGLATIKLETTSTSTQSGQSLGTVRWLAPELLKRGAKPTFESDIYAAGMVLWELSSRKIPYSDAQNEQLVVSWIKDGEQEEIPAACPEKIREVIKRCWNLLPETRPKAGELATELEQAAPKKEETKERAWQADLTSSMLPGQKYTLLPASERDREKVLKFYSHTPIPGYEIQSVRTIYNPALDSAFQSHLAKLQERAQNHAFDPKWAWEMGEVKWRQQVDSMFQKMAEPYTDPDYPSVKLLPLWHGTDPAIVDSICRVGYANLATTDRGFFGKGLYSAHEAEYAFRVYSKGALILNWVAIYSAYPVVKGDITKLSGKANYENYDAHFVPVSPKDPLNPRETNYYPCEPYSPHAYTEVVVFESAACLPSYLVELKKIEGYPFPQEALSARKLPPPPSQSVSAPVRSVSQSSPSLPLPPIKRNSAPQAMEPREWKSPVTSSPSLSPALRMGTSSTTRLSHPGPLEVEKKEVPLTKKEDKEDLSTPEAQYKFGLKYYLGDGVKQNYETAVRYFHLAADQGHALAQFKLGVCYGSGNLGVTKDKIKEEKYLNLAFGQGVIQQFEASAKKGSIPDLNHLGFCYQHGLGVKQDFLLAVKYFMMAANKGDAIAQNNLGLCFENGPEVIRDYKEAVKWYTLSANQGYANAQYNLGICFEKGQGVDQDLKKAVEYYTLAANQGHVYAQNNLGVCLKKWQDIRDLVAAAKYFQLAADQGNANAQYNLGVCYELGEGVEKDLDKALVYFRLSANQDNKLAKEKVATMESRTSRKIKRVFTDGKKK